MLLVSLALDIELGPRQNDTNYTLVIHNYHLTCIMTYFWIHPGCILDVPLLHLGCTLALFGLVFGVQLIHWKKSDPPDRYKISSLTKSKFSSKKMTGTGLDVPENRGRLQPITFFPLKLVEYLEKGAGLIWLQEGNKF